MTKRQAEKTAESYGCSLDAEYTGAANGWSITLDAPEGMVFKSSGCSTDCDITGNGLLKNDIEWYATIESIHSACACGFENDEG